MLRSLHLKGVGPAPRFDLEFGERLNVLTGDNGLGKSFVLDVAWWALTGAWVGRPALPRPGQEQEARIDGVFQTTDSRADTLWGGLFAEDKAICNGLVQDWVTW